MSSYGIVTLPGRYNYGNRLQAFALVQAVKHLGGDAVQLEFDDVNSPSVRNTYTWKLWSILRKLKPSNRHISMGKANAGLSLKISLITEFNDQWIPVRHISPRERSVIHNEYSAFIAGSDQIWNPDLLTRNLPFHPRGEDEFLHFAPVEKRFSYAASFGVSKIPKEMQKSYRSMLKQMNGVSVREDRGADIVHELTGRHVPVVLDPVMLLTKDFWLSLPLSPERNQIPEQPFILIYTLRGLQSETKSHFESFARRNNLEILSVMGDFYDPNSTVLSPIEFVHAISRASLVITDSFHASAFSILMNIPIQIMPRADGDSMASRLDTLLSLFGLRESRYTSDADLVAIANKCSFDKVNLILEQKRKESFSYLSSIQA